MQTLTPSTFVGIDVSKAELEIAILPEKQTLRFVNTAEGAESLDSSLEVLTSLLQERTAPLVVLEATGNLHLPVAKRLHQAGIAVSIQNPRHTYHFAKTLGRLAKTDRIDAMLLALYAQRLTPAPSQFPNEVQEELKALVGRRQDVVAMLTEEKNRLKEAQTASVKTAIESIIGVLEQQRQELEKAIRSLIASNNELKKAAKILTEVSGVGPVLVSMLLAKLPELGRCNRKEIAALVGVAPYDCQSGQSKGLKRIWGGRKSVRNALYQGANIARRYDPQMKAYYEHLRQKGKPFKVALVACMRKMLIRLNARVREAFYTLHIPSPLLT